MTASTGRGSGSHRPPRTFRVGVATRLFIVLFAASTAGCVAVPIKAPRIQTPIAGEFKGRVDATFLREGVTPRAEVMQKMGMLSSGYQHPRLFVARWQDSQWLVLWAAGGGYSAAAGASRRWSQHTLFIWFDEFDVLAKVELVPEKRLLSSIRDHGLTGENSQETFTVELEHQHLWGHAGTATMTLSREGVLFRERDKARHDFQTPLMNIRDVRLRGPRRIRNNPVPDEFEMELRFVRKTPGGVLLIFYVDFPTLVELTQLAHQHGVPLK